MAPQVGDVQFPYSQTGVAAAHIYAAVSGQPMVMEEDQAEMAGGQMGPGGGPPSPGAGGSQAGYGGPPLSSPADQGMPPGPGGGGMSGLSGMAGFSGGAMGGMGGGASPMPPAPSVAGAGPAMMGSSPSSDFGTGIPSAPTVAMHPLSVHGRRSSKLTAKAKTTKAKAGALKG